MTFTIRILLPLVPILTFPVLWAIFYKRLANWRSSFLAAAILWATFLVSITELLSAFRVLRAASVMLLWSLALIAAMLWALRLIGDPRRLWKGFRWPQFSAFELLLLGACAVIVIVTGLIAWVAPPNSFDSMTYHLPKIMHWIQDRSVAYYPTHILRQLYLAPGAEYIILHLQILAASDQLDNLVQWFSMIGSTIGVSLIAAQLGAGRKGQVLTAVAAVTISTGILEASGTQTDYVTTFWLVCFVSWMLQLRQEWSWLSVAVAGASLGMAALTKATTYIFALPFLAWFAASLVRRYRWQAAGLGAAVLIFLLINLPTYVRNDQLFGNPVGITTDGTVRPPQISYKLSNDVFSPAELASNVVRNIALHLGTSISPLNAFFEQQIIQMHSLIGISPDDPRTTWPEQRFHIVPPLYLEALDGNFLHLIFIALSAFAILLHPRRYKAWIPYGLCLLAGFLIFSFYLRWQPYGARLQLPLFVLYSAVLGKVGEDIEHRWKGGAVAVVLARRQPDDQFRAGAILRRRVLWLWRPSIGIGGSTLAIILLVGAWPWLMTNIERPLIGRKSILRTSRTETFFNYRPVEWKTSYLSAVNFIGSQTARHCSRVGVYMDSNDFEYLLWPLLNERTGKPVLVESVDVQNISRLAFANSLQFTPCAIFVMNPPPTSGFNVSGQQYHQAWTSSLVSVFLP